MESVDLDINSYRLKELFDFFELGTSATEKELVQSYKEKRHNAERIYDRSERVTFETFLNDAFDAVRGNIVKPPSKTELPKQVNANKPPTESYLTKFLLTVDSNFRKNKDSTSPTDFVIDLPMIFDRVVEVELVATEIPLTSYNFSSRKHNNKFSISFGEETHTITVPDGAWYSTELTEFINGTLTEGCLVYLTFEINEQSGHSIFRYKTDDELEHECIYAERSFDKYTLANVYETDTYERSCLYVFGFLEKDIESAISDENIFQYGTKIYTGVAQGSSVFGVTFDNYYYVYLNDFVTSKFNHQIIGIQEQGYIGDSIIGRVEINCTLFTRNIGNTSYVVRSYPGQVRIRKMHIKILDKYGEVVDNGLTDTVFLFRITCEQSSKKYEQVI